jgi:hypothetical protein
MSDHYVSLTRGTEGEKYVDFVTGTSSASTALFEFRVLDGVTPKKVEVIKALDAFKRFFENAQQVTTAGFDVAG